MTNTRTNKVLQVLRYLNRVNEPRSYTARELFKHQEMAVCYYATNDQFVFLRQCLCASYGMTVQQYLDAIRDPRLYTFYSPGLTDERLIALNREMKVLCHHYGVFTADWTSNQFTSHCNAYAKRKRLKRYQINGTWRYPSAQ